MCSHLDLSTQSHENRLKSGLTKGYESLMSVVKIVLAL